MGDDHVAIGAGLLVKADAIADIESLRHVDLHVVDEIAVPDRLEQAVAEAEGEDVLRRLLAEEMVDAEDLVLGEHFVQRVVERDRALEIGAERLFHNDARALGEIGLAQHLDRRQRGVRRHAHVVDALGLLVEGLLRLLDRLLESAGAGRHRHVVEQSPRTPATPPSWGRWACCSNTASRAMARKASASIASSDTPMIRHFGMKPALTRWKRPGSSFLWARSPVAPNRTTICGSLGPTPTGIFAMALSTLALAFGADASFPPCATEMRQARD